MQDCNIQELCEVYNKANRLRHNEYKLRSKRGRRGQSWSAEDEARLQQRRQEFLTISSVVRAELKRLDIVITRYWGENRIKCLETVADRKERLMIQRLQSKLFDMRMKLDTLGIRS